MHTHIHTHTHTQVQHLEKTIGDQKQKQVDFLEKAHQHERTIQGLRPYEPSNAQGLNLDLSSPSPIHPGARGFSLSPTLPMSGFTPGKEGSGGVSPRYGLKYPYTSTPASTVN